jgi:NADH dehydrogenase FAD-containing subunit
LDLIPHGFNNNSSAVGTLEFRAIIEPVRQYRKDIQFHAAKCEAIDFKNKTIRCVSTLDDTQESFSMQYDKLVIAPGAQSNTFGIPGVRENAIFLKDIEDAKRIRRRVIECFEVSTHLFP